MVLGALLAVAAVPTGLLASGLLALGGHGIADLAATVVHAFSACIFFLIEFRHVPLTSSIALVLAGASMLAFARTLRTFFVHDRLLRSLPLKPLDGPHAHASRAADVDVFVTPANRPAAFCFGLFKPRVVVTEGLLARLDDEEQAAAVYHELHHARSFEPLKCLIARLAASTFFWLPVLADLLDRYLLVKELAADRLAARQTSLRALAGALHEVSGTSTPATAVGLAEHAAARVDRLFDPLAALPPLWRGSRLVLSALAAGAVVSVALAPASVAVGAPGHLQSIIWGSAHGSAGTCPGFVFNIAVVLLALTATLAVASTRRTRRRRPTTHG